MPELLIVLAIVVLLFGAKKIPDLAKGMGKGIKDFKKAIKEDDEEVVEVPRDEPCGAGLLGDDFYNVLAVERPGFSQESLFSIVVVLAQVLESPREASKYLCLFL
jgi:sec-independent protein translocase protein TatA